MPDVEAELHETIDNITADVARLKAVQARKRGVDPADPKATELAQEAVDIASAIVPKTVAERRLVDEASRD